MLVGHVTDQSHLWRHGAGAGTPGPLLLGGSAVSQRVTAASSQAGGKEDIFFFFGSALSVRTEGCLEYLFSDSWFNSEAGFASGTSAIF